MDYFMFTCIKQIKTIYNICNQMLSVHKSKVELNFKAILLYIYIFNFYRCEVFYFPHFL